MTSYKDAGVDIDEAERAVELIASSVRRPPSVLSGIGAFASVIAMPPGLRDPVLVSSTDGVGSKLGLAADLGDLSGIGQDLVAMCVGDLLTQNATPLFFLDYLATPKLNAEKVAAIVSSIDAACAEVGCALVGGETAELNGVFKPGRFELAGFVVGVAERDTLPDKSRLSPGDVLVGLPSSGVHANGMTLARMAIENAHQGAALDRELRALLAPTRLYHRQAAALREVPGVGAMAHITGGGLETNLRRALPDGLTPKISWDWKVPRVFHNIARAATVSDDEMRRTFNMGIGFVMCVQREMLEGVMSALVAVDEPVIVGSIEREL